MNERIKELNIQALVEVLNGQDPDNDIDKMYIPAQFTKKFAELLIRECIAVHVDDYGVDIISNALKKHFGIE